MTNYRITHQTQYQYKENVARSYNISHLIPKNCSYQHCSDVQIQILPQPDVCQEHQDYFGNQRVYFDIQEAHSALSVSFQSTVQVDSRPLIPLEESPAWNQIPEMLLQSEQAEDQAASQFVFESPHVPLFSELRQYALTAFPQDRPLLEAVRELTHQIFTDFTFDPKATTVSTPLKKVLQKRRGVCQDFTHLAIGCLRVLGLPARYVSGYLETIPPPGQPKLVGSDVSHAWFSVYAPAWGWVDFDPTNDLLPDQQHITLAWGRDFSDISPLKGVLFGGGTHQLQVSVDVARQDFS